MSHPGRKILNDHFSLIFLSRSLKGRNSFFNLVNCIIKIRHVIFSKILNFFFCECIQKIN